LTLLAVQGLSAYPDSRDCPPPGDQETLAQPSLAEQYLFRLSDKKKAPKIGGTIGLAVGVAGVAGGLAISGRGREDDPLGLPGSWAILSRLARSPLAPGSLLSVKSRAERADARIRAVSDAAEGLAAAAALADLAESEKRPMIRAGPHRPGPWPPLVRSLRAFDGGHSGDGRVLLPGEKPGGESAPIL
jgi:hypothetical protein